MTAAKKYAAAAGMVLALGISQVARAQAPTATPAPVVPTTGEQRAAMQADADRLLKLAQQLKAEVDKTRRDELNVQVIRQAEEIEKLARSARGRIR